MPFHDHKTLSATDGHDIQVQIWQPDGDTSCVIQVLHGLGEYGDRYARFAAAVNARGFAVCVHDHRGHGSHADELGHFADDDGWHKINSDTEIVNDFLRDEFDGVSLVLLGHSMGSYIAQAFAMHYGERLSGLILSAPNWTSRLQLAAVNTLAYIEAKRLGGRSNSRLLHYFGFGQFNRPFAPVRTKHDWLSRDEQEVDKYVADPLCGGPYSCRLWLDLIGGLFYISSDHALMRIPSELPILISGGELDPVGGDKGMARLALHFAQTSHQRLKVKIYADGRHEMLNESNRDQVTDDWLDWVAAVARSGQSK